MLPKLNRKRALFVLTKIDEILAWDQRCETERDTRFVELGRYLLSDVHPRATAATGKEGSEGNRLDEGIRAGEGGASGGSALRLCNLAAQSPGNAQGAIQTRS